MSKTQPSSFDATASVLHRLLPIDRNPYGDVAGAREPASNAAVIFSAIVQARAIDRLTAAVEKNTRAVMLASDDTLSRRDKYKKLLEESRS